MEISTLFFYYCSIFSIPLYDIIQRHCVLNYFLWTKMCRITLLFSYYSSILFFNPTERHCTEILCIELFSINKSVQNILLFPSPIIVPSFFTPTIQNIEMLYFELFSIKKNRCQKVSIPLSSYHYFVLPFVTILEYPQVKKVPDTRALKQST